MAERHNIGPHHLLIRPWLSYLAGTFLGREKAVNCVTLPRNCRFPRFVSAAFFHLRRRKARGGGRGRDESTNGRLYRHGTILRSIRGRTGGMNVKYSNFNSSSSISSPFFFFFEKLLFWIWNSGFFLHSIARDMFARIRGRNHSSYFSIVVNVNDLRTMGTIGIITDVGGVKRCKEAEWLRPYHWYCNSRAGPRSQSSVNTVLRIDTRILCGDIRGNTHRINNSKRAERAGSERMNIKVPLCLRPVFVRLSFHPYRYDYNIFTSASSHCFLTSTKRGPLIEFLALLSCEIIEKK